MGIATSKDGSVVVLGNFSEVKRYKTKDGFPPGDWMDHDWKAIVPFDFEWRDKLGKVECDCKEVEIHHMPYYGFTWYHMKDCAIMKHYEKYPQMANLGIIPGVIAMSE